MKSVKDWVEFDERRVNAIPSETAAQYAEPVSHDLVRAIQLDALRWAVSVDPDDVEAAISKLENGQ